MGAIIGLGLRTLSIDDVQFLLDNPNPSNWQYHYILGSPFGLYLNDIKYDETGICILIILQIIF